MRLTPNTQKHRQKCDTTLYRRLKTPKRLRHPPMLTPLFSQTPSQSDTRLSVLPLIGPHFKILFLSSTPSVAVWGTFNLSLKGAPSEEYHDLWSRVLCSTELTSSTCSPDFFLPGHSLVRSFAWYSAQLSYRDVCSLKSYLFFMQNISF